MNYDAIIKRLEIEIKNIDAKINEPEANVSMLNEQRFALFEQLRNYRKLQYESQFDIMNDDDYRY